MASRVLRIGYPTPGVRTLSCDTGLYTISGSTARRDYILSASSGSYSVSGQDAVIFESEAGQLVWPTHSPGYIPVLPGHGGYGMDTPGGTGRHLATPATSIILVDSLAATNSGSARPELGTNVYSGTFEYAWRHSASPKVIIPIISGWTNYGASIPMQTGTPPRPGYVSYWGQFAPDPGFYLRGTRPHLNGASNCVIMHMRSYMGDDVAGLGADNRDSFGSGYGGGTTSYIVLINNEFGFSIDELCDHFRPHTLVSWLYNAFVYPLHDSIIEHTGDPSDTDHGFGPIMGGDTIQAGSFTCFRNVFAHGTGRNPATTAQQLVYANNLNYNHGRPGGGNGQALDIWSANTTNPMLANIIGNGFVKGPENTGSTIVAVRVVSGAPAGTQGYLSNNAAGGGWTADNQFSFVNSGVGTWQQTTLRTGAFPGSWGTESAACLDWFSGTQPTTDEWSAFLDLMEASCGAQPILRHPAGPTPVSTVFQQIRYRTTEGTADSFQFIDTVQEYTGNASTSDPYWPVTSTLIDPTDPGSNWHAPLPTGAGRDTPYTTGTFSNGLSRVGRSPLEVWAIEEHWRKGGK